MRSTCGTAPRSRSSTPAWLCSKRSGASADNELVPLRIFSLASKIGGQVIGAWDGDTHGGLCVLDSRRCTTAHPYLHSHMLASEGELSQHADWAGASSYFSARMPSRRATS